MIHLRPHRLWHLPLSVSLAAGLWAMAGCGGSDRDLIDVQGRVTYKGQPVARAILGFSPVDVRIGASQRPATAITDDQGIYRLKAYRDEFGMPPGTYRVSILCYEGSMAEPETVRYVVPKEYSDAETSGLTAEIPPAYARPLTLDFHLP